MTSYLDQVERPGSANNSRLVNQSGRPKAVVLCSESSTTVAPAGAHGHLIHETWGNGRFTL